MTSPADLEPIGDYVTACGYLPAPLLPRAAPGRGLPVEGAGAQQAPQAAAPARAVSVPELAVGLVTGFASYGA